MRNQFLFAAVTTLIFDGVIHVLNKKRHEILQESYLSLCDDHDHLLQDVNYLIDIINRNDIKLDEFDLIALHSVTIAKNV